MAEKVSPLHHTVIGTTGLLHERHDLDAFTLVPMLQRQSRHLPQRAFLQPASPMISERQFFMRVPSD